MPANLASSCSALHRDAPLQGTAPVQRTWLVVECPRPWAPKVEQSPAFPPAVRACHERFKAHLDYGLLARVPLSQDRELRAVVYRFEGPGRVRQFSAPAESACEWLEAVLGGEPQGAPAEPCLYVCTHGSRDSCCGRLGVPLLRAARALGGRPVFESSHLGGHRFAATALLLPEWRVYGRLAPEQAPGLLAGQLTPEFLRGSAWLEPVLQVAEPAVEAACGGPVEALELLEQDGQRCQLLARTVTGETRRFLAWISVQQRTSPLSCGDRESGHHTEYRLLRLASCE